MGGFYRYCVQRKELPEILVRQSSKYTRNAPENILNGSNITVKVKTRNSRYEGILKRY